MILNTALTCLALNLYFEARSEPLLAQVSVGQVTLNRVSHSRYPNTICGVVTQKSQFSWFSDGLSDKPKEKAAWGRALALAELMLEKPIKVTCVGKSTHYHADYVRPYWAKAKFFKKTCQVGTHIFYKETSA
tara:strand:- start:4185 stop:4580 length:396 start_codon:yes stop_codon:yes gene_type:complete